MKTTLKILAVATMIFAAGTVSAQDAAVNEEKEYKLEKKVRPFRLGSKLGLPNLIGGNIEYVTPLLNEKLAVSFDYSLLKSDWLGLEVSNTNEEYGEYGEYANEMLEKINLDINYIGGGLHYYFFKPGRGLYSGLSYGILKIKGTIPYENGMEITDFSHNSFNVKLGAKLGGLFYFRPEVGYSFDSLPETYDVEFIYTDGSTETRTKDNPVGFLPSGLIANIGLGFAF